MPIRITHLSKAYIKGLEYDPNNYKLREFMKKQGWDTGSGARDAVQEVEEGGQ